VKGFKKYCISTAVGRIVGKLWRGNEDGGNVSSECEEDEGTDC
jgi:hypothetical protein